MTSAEMISVCIAIRNQAHLVNHTLDSIYAQVVPGYSLEVVVTDDGSDDGTDKVLDNYPVVRLHIDNRTYRNGVFAKNSSLRNAHGDIVIQQSADVILPQPNVIASLVEALPESRAVFAEVHNYHLEDGRADDFQYTGPLNHRPFFFLGACYREDVCRVGGYDPLLGNVIYYDDNWHADCMINTCRVRPKFLPVIAWHQNHSRQTYNTAPAKKVYYDLLRKAVRGMIPYVSSSGAWGYSPGRSVVEVEGGTV